MISLGLKQLVSPVEPVKLLKPEWKKIVSQLAVSLVELVRLVESIRLKRKLGS